MNCGKTFVKRFDLRLNKIFCYEKYSQACILALLSKIKKSTIFFINLISIIFYKIYLLNINKSFTKPILVAKFSFAICHVFCLFWFVVGVFGVNGLIYHYVQKFSVVCKIQNLCGKKKLGERHELDAFILFFSRLCLKVSNEYNSDLGNILFTVKTRTKNPPVSNFIKFVNQKGRNMSSQSLA